MVDEKYVSGNIKQYSLNNYPLLWFDMIIYSLRSTLHDDNDFALSPKKMILDTLCCCAHRFSGSPFLSSPMCACMCGTCVGV